MDTFGSDFDTGLAIYTGSCDALTEVACNDDTGGVTSQVTLPTTAGMTYSILVGGYGSDAGNLVLHLNHLTPPAFVVEPTNQSVIVSNTASFSATLTGALPMSFQWYFNGNPLVDDGRIVGSMTASLSISSLTTADAGSYSLAVTNFLGSANSSNAVLTVLVPPGITLQPIGRSVPPGLPTTFNAAATGIPTPTYQWQLNGTNIPGATSSSYTNPAVGTNDLGFYHVVASNSVSIYGQRRCATDLWAGGRMGKKSYQRMSAAAGIEQCHLCRGTLWREFCRANGWNHCFSWAVET